MTEPRERYDIRLGKYIIVKARQEAGGRGQEEDHYSIKTGSGMTLFERATISGYCNSLGSIGNLSKLEQISGQRDSNARHSPWQGDALPLSYARTLISVVII